MILDTDFLIDVLRRRQSAIEKLTELRDSPEELFVTHINLCELYRGAYQSKNIQENLVEIDTLLNYLGILPFTQTADQRFGELITQLEKQGRKIGEMDTLIASLALDQGQMILTRNIKHFKQTGVAIATYQ
ncbi:MAG: type II toxin-antitoxin system VapC family toxin [Candidatus Hodarchaeales archaeon]|jgi:tRNA(fMet)-specific endonuclease VapC